MATINGAKALKIDNITGSIEEGKKADLIIIDLKSEMTQPENDIFSSIVYNVSPENVITTIINGKIIMEDRNIQNVDENDVYERCNTIIKRIT